MIYKKQYELDVRRRRRAMRTSDRKAAAFLGPPKLGVSARSWTGLRRLWYRRGLGCLSRLGNSSRLRGRGRWRHRGGSRRLGRTPIVIRFPRALRWAGRNGWDIRDARDAAANRNICQYGRAGSIKCVLTSCHYANTICQGTGIR